MRGAGPTDASLHRAPAVRPVRAARVCHHDSRARSRGPRQPHRGATAVLRRDLGRLSVALEHHGGCGVRAVPGALVRAGMRGARPADRALHPRRHRRAGAAPAARAALPVRAVVPRHRARLVHAVGTPRCDAHRLGLELRLRAAVSRDRRGHRDVLRLGARGGDGRVSHQHARERTQSGPLDRGRNHAVPRGGRDHGRCSAVARLAGPAARHDRVRAHGHHVRVEPEPLRLLDPLARHVRGADHRDDERGARAPAPRRARALGERGAGAHARPATRDAGVAAHRRAPLAAPGRAGDRGEGRPRLALRARHATHSGVGHRHPCARSRPCSSGSCSRGAWSRSVSSPRASRTR